MVNLIDGHINRTVHDWLYYAKSRIPSLDIETIRQELNYAI